MKITTFETSLYVQEIKEHNNNKDNILKLIKEMPDNQYSRDDQTISKTDWNVPSDRHRDYLTAFYRMIAPYYDNLMKTLKFTKWEIFNGWFQQYIKSDYHSWHVHPTGNYTNVYYLEMPEHHMKTEIYNTTTNDIIYIDVHEGDLITFPAFLHHRSPVIHSDKRKTIISFNSSFDCVDLDKMEK